MAKAAERTQRQLLELLKLPGNGECADCGGRNPRWAAWDHGIFICVQCAGLHRKMGTHISKVKSLTLDTWSREQVEHMRSVGNIASNSKLNPSGERPPPSSIDEGERENQLEKFIRAKYERREFAGSSPPMATNPPPSSVVPESTPVVPTIVQAKAQAPQQPLMPRPNDTESAKFPPRPAVAVAQRPDVAPERPKHVRFRSASTPIPEFEDDEPLPRAPSAGARPSKSILRPRSASSTQQGSPMGYQAGGSMAGMDWLDGLLTGQPAGGVRDGATSFASSGHPSSNTSTMNSSEGDSTARQRSNSAFAPNAMLAAAPRTASPFASQLAARSSSPFGITAPPLNPSFQPQTVNAQQSSIWGDLDFLGASDQSAPQANTNHSQYRSQLDSNHLQPPMAPFARDLQPSPSPPPPAPAPLRPQFTGFVPSSDFGRQLASEFTSSSDVHNEPQSSSFLRPQQTGGSPLPQPLRPQLTGWNPPSQQESNPQNGFRAPQVQQQQRATSPFHQQQPQSSAFFSSTPLQQPTVSLNPFHSGINSLDSIGKALPASVQRPMATGTNPFYLSQPPPQQFQQQQHQAYHQPQQAQQYLMQQYTGGQAGFGGHLQPMRPQTTGYAYQQPQQQQQQHYQQQTNPFLQGWQSAPSQQWRS